MKIYLPRINSVKINLLTVETNKHQLLPLYSHTFGLLKLIYADPGVAASQHGVNTGRYYAWPLTAWPLKRHTPPPPVACFHASGDCATTLSVGTGEGRKAPGGSEWRWTKGTAKGWGRGQCVSLSARSRSISFWVSKTWRARHMARGGGGYGIQQAPWGPTFFNLNKNKFSDREMTGCGKKINYVCIVEKLRSRQHVPQAETNSRWVYGFLSRETTYIFFPKQKNVSNVVTELLIPPCIEQGRTPRNFKDPLQHHCVEVSGEGLFSLGQIRQKKRKGISGDTPGPRGSSMC